MTLFTYTDMQLSCHNLRVTSIVNLILTVCILFFALCHPATAQTVHIPDPNLRAVLESVLAKKVGEDITQVDIANLESLDAFGSGIRNLTGLEFATNLIELRLGNNKISDVSPLKDLTSLTQLSIKGNRISDVSPLKDLTNLTYLHIGYNQIPDVSPLKNLTNLTFLELDENKISDVSLLKNLTNLTELYLDDNEILDVTPLENLTNLIKLNLNDNKISDISTLKYFTNLIFLDIHGNQISDMSSLKNMKELSVLNFHENQISDISPLKNLKKIKVLKCDDNEISDVTPLKNLTNLTELYLSGNQIPDATPLKNLTKLKVLDLSHNHISDFSPITDLIDNLIEYDFSNQTQSPTDVGSEIPAISADVNRDRIVNVSDLVLVAANFHNQDLEALAETNIYPDVNSDGVVDLIDLLTVAVEIGSEAAAPLLSQSMVESLNLTAEKLTHWIRIAKQLDVQIPNLPRGISVLEQLLTLISSGERLPKTTALLANYPNPFNPETWIPYQLSIPAKVIISIHSSNGELVRKLELERLPAGIYHDKRRAAYWDGRNALGEPIASGIYFYTLTAGDFTASRKMLIRK